MGADGTVQAQAGQGEALLIADLPPPDPILLSTQINDYRVVD